MRELGTKIRELRQNAKLTQTAMAKKFGIDRSFLCEIENGKKLPSITTLQIIALGFNTTLSKLLEGL